jgi:hypothetical protein
MVNSLSQPSWRTRSGSATLVVVTVAIAKYRASTTFQSAPSV